MRLLPTAIVGVIVLLALPAAALARESGVRVAVVLESPPLVEHAAAQRSPLAYARAGRLDVGAFGSRLYLAQLAREQALAARLIQVSIPGAIVGVRMRVVLNALSVSVPAGALARLEQIPGVADVLISQRMHRLTDSLPRVVGATASWGLQGASSGQGVRIAVVDDGVDASHPFFRADGQHAPAGWPRGQRDFTRGRVIVARAFPPPGSRGASTRAFDPQTSSHGTHVAGIAAGARATVARPRGGLPTVHGLSGVAPTAFVGNYRALTEPDPQYGLVGGAAEIAAAIDGAVADRMQVVNLSIGGYEVEPRADPVVRAVAGAVRAGVVVVSAAGNERDVLGEGSVGSPGSSPDAITVGATTNARAFGTRLRVRGSAGAPALPAALRGALAAAIGGVDLPARAARLTRLRAVTPGGLCKEPRPGRHRGLVLLVRERGCPLEQIAQNAYEAGAVLLLAQIAGPGDPPRIETDLPVPAVLVSDLTADTLRGYLRTVGANVRVAVGRSVREQRGGAGVVTGFSSSGPTPFDRVLKPDISAPGQTVLSSVPLNSPDFPASFAVFDGTSMATPAVAGAAALVLQRHPGWRPDQVRAALVASATPAYVDTARTRQASPLRAGAGMLDVAGAVDPLILPEPASLSFGVVAQRGAQTRTASLTVADAGGGEGDWVVAVGSRQALRGVRVVAPTSLRIPAGSSAELRLRVDVGAGAPEGDVAGHITLTRSSGGQLRRVPYWIGVSRPTLRGSRVRVLPRPGTYTGDTRLGSTRVERYRYPSDPSVLGLPKVWRGPEQIWSFRLRRPAQNAGVSVEAIGGARVAPILLRSLDEDTVAGAGALPLDIGPNPQTLETPVPAAGLMSPRPGVYYVAVDSRWPRFGGRYRLHFWVDDRRPPRVDLLTPALPASGRPELRLRVLDAASGVDIRTLSINGPGFEGLGPSSWDDRYGIARFLLPRMPEGRQEVRVEVSDLAQSKDAIAARPTPRNTAKVRVSVLVG